MSILSFKQYYSKMTYIKTAEINENNEWLAITARNETTPSTLQT